jgi:hypothetical protein
VAVRISAPVCEFSTTIVLAPPNAGTATTSSTPSSFTSPVATRTPPVKPSNTVVL